MQASKIVTQHKHTVSVLSKQWWPHCVDGPITYQNNCKQLMPAIVDSHNIDASKEYYERLSEEIHLLGGLSNSVCLTMTLSNTIVLF